MWSSTEHAVWRLLDRIGDAGTSHLQANGARAAALLATCRPLVEQIATSSVPTRRSAVAPSRTRRRARRATATAVARRTPANKRAATRRTPRGARTTAGASAGQATDADACRSGPGLDRFATGTWARVLAESMPRDGKQDDATRGCIKLVDELPWSVQLPDHPQSRQRLLVLLPGLLQRLRAGAGMALIDLPATEQPHVLDEWLAVRAESLRPRARGTDADALTSEQIVQRICDEVLAPSTGHGAFSNSVIDLASMQTVPAELTPESATDEPAMQVDALQPGDRQRLFLHGVWAEVRLIRFSDR